MKTMTQVLKQILNALAAADAGEYLMLSQKARYLDSAPTQPTPQPTVKPASAQSPQKQVGLYLGSELSPHTADYVLQMCQRMDYGLTVLTLQPEARARDLLAPLVQTLKEAGIALRVRSLEGEPLAALSRYLRRHPEVAFLACNETGFLGWKLVNGTQTSNALPIPVVLVTPRGADAIENRKATQDATDTRAA